MSAALIKHMAQVRQLYGPNLGTLTDNMSSMGVSLQSACNALTAEPTLARIDELVSLLKTAHQTVTSFRLAMLERRTEGHGTG